ncbi:carboxymuconolactone decarboxylase family protein [Pseudogemmobacter sonorensis]|uniref:carboxymuconolactone decarboxylase family protein n=1 Tax=Pseudogemmobacter sonorensis TaxID=2989681 RepID=UPI00369C3D01
MTRHPDLTGERFEKGIEIRRDVLGSAYVDRSIAAATDVTAPLQKLVTEYCWAEVWGRPGLARRDRSLLNLGMLIAMNRPHELRIHLRGAIQNGVTREEIIEVVLQSAIYCGVPASLDAMRVVTETFKDLDGEAARD